MDDLERWAAEARAADAVEARVRERWLRTQAAESSTLAGVLIALAEASTPVVVTTSSGRRHGGLVAMVGVDFFAVRRHEQVTLISLAALAAVQASPGGSIAPTDGEPGERAASVTLRDVLARAVGDRPRLRVQAGGALIAGELVGVGLDVVTLRTDGQPVGWAYVAVTSVSEASLLDSG